MSDTPPEVAVRYHAMLMAKSGSDRVRMAAEMYHAAVVMVVASLGHIEDPRERRRARFRRVYSDDFSPAELDRILALL